MDLHLHEVLFGGREQQTFGVQRTDDVIPDGASLFVVTAHPSTPEPLKHLTDAFISSVTINTSLLLGLMGSWKETNLWRLPDGYDVVHLHLHPELHMLPRQTKTGADGPHVQLDIYVSVL